MRGTEQIRHQRLHPAPGKKRGRVVLRNQRRRREYCMPLAFKKPQIFIPHLIRGHCVLSYPSSRNFGTMHAHMYWGFDTKNIDKKVRAQDDFYDYANGGWLKKTKIPPEESRCGSFTILRYRTEQQLKKIVTTTRYPKVAGIYRSAIDMKTRNKLDAGPMAPLRLLVRDIKTKEDLLKVIARLHVLGVSAGWGAFVDQDSKDSSRYALHLWQGGLGMPERDYYLLNKPEQKRVRAAYIEHIKKLSALAGATAKESEEIQRPVLRIETALAKASMKKEDPRDSEKVYHKLTLAQLQKLSPNIGWADYFARTHASGVKTLILGQPAFFK